MAQNSHNRYTPPAPGAHYPLPPCYRLVRPFALRCVFAGGHNRGCSGLPLFERSGRVAVKDVPGLRKGEVCIPIR